MKEITISSVSFIDLVDSALTLPPEGQPHLMMVRQGPLDLQFTLLNSDPPISIYLRSDGTWIAAMQIRPHKENHHGG